MSRGVLLQFQFLFYFIGSVLGKITSLSKNKANPNKIGATYAVGDGREVNRGPTPSTGSQKLQGQSHTSAPALPAATGGSVFILLMTRLCPECDTCVVTVQYGDGSSSTAQAAHSDRPSCVELVLSVLTS